MKSFFFNIQILFSLAVCGQSSIDGKVNGLFKSLKDVTIVSDFPDSIFKTQFYRSYGVHGNAYCMKANKTFDFIHGQTLSHKGNWRFIKEKQLLILSSGKNISRYYVVRFDKYYYLVPIKQVEAFMSRLQLMEQKHKNAKSIKVDNRTFAAVDKIAIGLANGYYWINPL